MRLTILIILYLCFIVLSQSPQDAGDLDNTDAIALDDATQYYWEHGPQDEENTETETATPTQEEPSQTDIATQSDHDTPDNALQPRFAQASLGQKGFLKSVVKGVKKVASFVGGLFKKKKKPKPPPPKPTGKDVEDCVACRFIWLQVEEEVGEGDIGLARAAFIKRCIDAQESTIFYNPCSMMYDRLDTMCSYYTRSYSVNQICENGRMCR